MFGFFKALARAARALNTFAEHIEEGNARLAGDQHDDEPGRLAHQADAGDVVDEPANGRKRRVTAAK